MCVCGMCGGHMCHTAHVEARCKLCGVTGSLLLRLWTPGMKSGCQAWSAGPLPMEPSRQPPGGDPLLNTKCIFVSWSLCMCSSHEPTLSLQAVTQGPYSVVLVLDVQFRSVSFLNDPWSCSTNRSTKKWLLPCLRRVKFTSCFPFLW